jgi:ABC-type bacteriocin/lantibiotic exporter with double-glycine peptidase domain
MTVLNVLHFAQSVDGFCLPACAQMVLTYLGVDCSEASLARQLGSSARLGTPYARIVLLRTSRLDVAYDLHGNADTLRGLTERGLPAIVFVQTSELSYWRKHVSRHAIVVVGMEPAVVYVLDPAMPPAPLSVPLDELMLAWDEMDNAYAVLSLR